MKLLQIRERDGGFYRGGKYNVFFLDVNVLHDSYHKHIPSRTKNSVLCTLRNDIRAFTLALLQLHWRIRKWCLLRVP
jgi:hypothetical protein